MRSASGEDKGLLSTFSRLWYDVSVRLSVTEVHWRIIANLGLPRIAVAVHAGARDHRQEETGGSSRAMLATARPSCSFIVAMSTIHWHCHHAAPHSMTSDPVCMNLNFVAAVFSARCNIYISRLCYDVSARLSIRLSVSARCIYYISR